MRETVKGFIRISGGQADFALDKDAKRWGRITLEGKFQQQISGKQGIFHASFMHEYNEVDKTQPEEWKLLEIGDKV